MPGGGSMPGGGWVPGGGSMPGGGWVPGGGCMESVRSREGFTGQVR